VHIKKLLKDWVLPFAIVIIVSFAIRTYGYAHIKVYNISMQNTLFEGHRLLEDKISYRFIEPARGDIIIVNGPEYPERLIKRIIGMPGEIIDMQGGQVQINGRNLEETYAKGLTDQQSLPMPYTIPNDSVFVMGDNREHSIDSRSLGAIPLTSIEGKAVLRFWPMSKFGTMD